MYLADRVAQYRAPFAVMDSMTGCVTTLDNTSSWSKTVEGCPVRYVLQDELVRLCGELAYSKGSQTLQCADLLHAPAEAFWVEWAYEPWISSLEHCGFPPVRDGEGRGGRRGAFVRTSPDGRRGLIRTFWSTTREDDVFASSMEAYFDFDTAEGEEPRKPDGMRSSVGRVIDSAHQGADVLGRCFRFRYHESWQRYYEGAAVSSLRSKSIWAHNLGTIAIDVPLLLTFFLLLVSRASLPQKLRSHERLNRSRRKAGKAPLLDQIEVNAPLLPDYRNTSPRVESHDIRRGPRLHRVRGHLVRRGNQLFWRMPHLRGSARWGAVRSQTVVWTFDDTPLKRHGALRTVEQAAVALSEKPAESPTRKRN